MIIQRSLNFQKRMNDGKSDHIKTQEPLYITTFPQTIFYIIGSILGGLYLGFSSKTFKQSWNKCFILLGLSLYCTIMTIYTKKYSHKKVYVSFIFCFFIAALSVPISFWFSEQII